MVSPALDSGLIGGMGPGVGTWTALGIGGAPLAGTRPFPHSSTGAHFQHPFSTHQQLEQGLECALGRYIKLTD